MAPGKSTLRKALALEIFLALKGWLSLRLMVNGQDLMAGSALVGSALAIAALFIGVAHSLMMMTTGRLTGVELIILRGNWVLVAASIAVFLAFLALIPVRLTRNWRSHGVYGYVRHPQYLGLILVTGGWLIHWPTIPGVAMWPLLLILYFRLSKREEQYLAERFGKQYSEYAERIPMLIPRWRRTT